MEEIRTRARLVDPAASSLFTRGLSTLVPRSEIEEALHRGEYPAPLFLDIARVGEGDDEVTAHARLMVDWDEPTLQELLRTTSDSEIRLSFDPDELERALDEAEVDAHGLREKMAVAAVAVAAAGAGAGAAAAHPQIVSDSGGGPAITAPAFTSDVASGGTGAPASLPTFTSDVASSGSGSAAGDAVSRYVANVGDDAAAQAPSFTSDVAAGDTGGTAVSFTSDVAAGGTGAPADVSPSFTSDVASGGTGSPQTDAVSRYVANISDDSATAPAGGGDSISLPSPAEGAGIAAGIALLITGAGFVAVRSRKAPPGLPA
jgi:hypothetical protein